jgi:oligopeptide/dipeptide ABC transporter ATP-binding protein
MVPNPLHWPTGCHFRDRCVRADADCSVAEPSLIEIETRHDVACFKVA